MNSLIKGIRRIPHYSNGPYGAALAWEVMMFDGNVYTIVVSKDYIDMAPDPEKTILWMVKGEIQNFLDKKLDQELEKIDLDETKIKFKSWNVYHTPGAYNHLHFEHLHDTSLLAVDPSMEPSDTGWVEAAVTKNGVVVVGTHESEINGTKVKEALANAVPGLDENADCPKCDGFKSTPLIALIQHVNDKHKMKRKDIADWLEELDIDLSFQEVVSEEAD